MKLKYRRVKERREQSKLILAGANGKRNRFCKDKKDILTEIHRTTVIKRQKKRVEKKGNVQTNKGLF